MATSTKQTVALVEVYDYVLTAGDPSSATTAKGISGKKVKVTLGYDRQRSSSPVTWLLETPTYSAVTDANGFWRVFVVPTDQMAIANSYYIVEVEGYAAYKIKPTQAGVPGIGWQSSAILLDIPPSLTIAGQTLTGPLTVQAALVAQSLTTLPSSPWTSDFPAGATNILTTGYSGNVYDKGGAYINVAGPKYRAIGTWDPVAGTGDATAAINQAIADLPAAGGMLFFPVGIYNINSTITLKTNTIYQGAGVGTVLVHNAGATAMLALTTQQTPANLVIRNMKVLKGTGTGDAILLGSVANQVSYVTIEQVWFFSIAGYCVNGVNILETYIEHCQTGQCLLGFFIGSNANVVRDNQFSNGGFGTVCLQINGYANTVDGNVIEAWRPGAGVYAVQLGSGSSYNRITNNWFEDNLLRSIKITSGAGSWSINNLIQGNNFSGLEEVLCTSYTLSAAFINNSQGTFTLNTSPDTNPCFFTFIGNNNPTITDGTNQNRDQVLRINNRADANPVIYQAGGVSLFSVSQAGQVRTNLNFYAAGSLIIGAQFTFQALANRVQLNGPFQTSGQIYPSDEALSMQASGGLLHSTGVPSNANGNNRDRSYSDNGITYFKSGGVWLTETAIPSTQTQPANPAATATLDPGVMMGLAGSITPNRTGKILVILSGDIFNTVINDGATVQLRFGTGAAPANGGALAGTVAGGKINYTAAIASEKTPFSAQAVISGLTLGTAVWLDVALGALVGGNATIENLSLTAVEI